MARKKSKPRAKKKSGARKSKASIKKKNLEKPKAVNAVTEKSDKPNDEPWFKEAGFFHNPFSIKPSFYNYEVEGYGDIIGEVDKGILQNKIIVIEGEFGTGKTSILKAIINHYRGQKRVCYQSCNMIKGELNIDSLLMGKYGALGRLLKIKGKNMLLLLDEANELHRNDFEKIKMYLGTHIRSVILTTDNIEHLTIQIDKGDDSLIYISLNKLTPSNAVELVRKRIGNVDMVSDEMLEYIYSKSDDNPRMYLENCEDVFRYAFENNFKVISEEDVDTALANVVKRQNE